ncbi:acylneuraminate cytidylyltransferase family protein [Thalassospira alkalitolerans]|uniref:acylneuraminate cytidylyltransferase family protein n=1 Tax=Thalassospira alkalitolerans TaxID=1293890 RepID=UPI0030EE7117|tara:strand:- start:25127 stop:25846 length:720 start_codon:yes stop_codon:yes gene_type:complete
MFGYIPARGGSSRIPKKNIRTLGGKPIIVHVIDSLKVLPFLSEVFVSTDNQEIADIAEGAGAVVLELRSPELSNSKSGFMDLIRDDIPRYVEASGGDDECLFCLATAGLLTPEILSEAYGAFRQNNPEILMSVEPYAEPIWWALREDDKGYLSPVFPDKVLINSQDLEPTYTDSGLFYLFKQSILSKYYSHKGAKKIEPFHVPYQYRVNVDVEEDWEMLEWKYNKLQKKSNFRGHSEKY